MMIKKFLLNIIEKTIIGFSIFVLYCSVLVGILFPMLIIGGFFIFLRNYYWISWYLADPTILGKDLVTCWLNSYLKVMIFLVGLILFLISLTTLILGIKKDVGLVQNKIYKHMRHPQILSIIIMAFPLFLYIGFRMGDFVSWVQFIFIMIIYSDIGDIKLKKKYPADFQTYYEKSGFFFPRIIPYRIGHYFSATLNKKFRYPLLLLIYILCIFTLYQIFLVLPFFPSYI